MNHSVAFITPRVITDPSSYWAMFYVAIFKALAYQKNIQFRLGDKSPQAHRGAYSTPSNFLAQIRSSIKNHAFEYLMMDMLCIDYGGLTRIQLVKKLLESCGITDFDYNCINIFKMGKDSIQYNNIKKGSFDVSVVVPKFNIKTGAREGIQFFTHPLNVAITNYPNSDLLLVVSDGRNHTYGFLGEVEGNNGKTLFRDSYWDGEKGKYATFAIGISNRKNIKIDEDTVQLSNNITLFTDTADRVILNYSNITFFAKDYLRAIHNMELFFNGQFENIGTGDDAGHDKIIKVIKDNWGNGSNIIIEKLSGWVRAEYAIVAMVYSKFNPQTKTFEFKPNPLILPDSYFLYEVES